MTRGRPDDQLLLRPRTGRTVRVSPEAPVEVRPRIPAVCVNTRTLHQRSSGVQRYLTQLLPLLPSGVAHVTPANRLKTGVGHLWEQVVLPGRRGSGLLWSPANVGPLAVKRQVVTVHDAATLDHPEWFGRAFAAAYGFVLPRLMRRVRRVITVSAFSRARLIEHAGVPEERVVAIPNGVDARFRPAPEEEVRRVRRRHDLGGAYVLAVGTLEPRKNLPRLIEAWRSVREAFPGYELAIAGGSVPGVFRDAFRDAGPVTARPGVRLLGYVPDDDLPGLYSGAAAFAYPSLYEGFGLPVLEAMACGTPVVTSDAAALPEVAGGAAVLVDPHACASIAGGLGAVLGDPGLRAELRERGLRRAAGFTWAETAARTWAVLEEAART